MLNVTSALEKVSGRGQFDGIELAPIKTHGPYRSPSTTTSKIILFHM